MRGWSLSAVYALCVAVGREVLPLLLQANLECDSGWGMVALSGVLARTLSVLNFVQPRVVAALGELDTMDATAHLHAPLVVLERAVAVPWKWLLPLQHAFTSLLAKVRLLGALPCCASSGGRLLVILPSPSLLCIRLAGVGVGSAQCVDPIPGQSTGRSLVPWAG